MSPYGMSGLELDPMGTTPACMSLSTPSATVDEINPALPIVRNIP